MEEMLVVDANEAIASRIGDQGIDREEIDGLLSSIATAHHNLEERRADGELGFWDLPMDPELAEASAQMARSLSERCDDLVVLGIGGSSLGAKAVVSALGGGIRNLLPREQRGGPRLHFPDNSDPSTFSALLRHLQPQLTAFLVVTKSGSTAETLAQFAIARGWLGEGWERQVAVITDPEKGDLRQLAKNFGLASLPVPPNVGGRFSVLSAVGQVPVAAAGLDLASLLQGANAMRQRCERPSLWENPAYLLAAFHFLFDQRGRRVHVFFPYADALRDVGDWFVQLWAESLGKSETIGPTPLRAVGATDQHSLLQLLMEGPQDKLVTFVQVGEHEADLEIPEHFRGRPAFDYLLGKRLGTLFDAEFEGTVAALSAAGRPSITLRLPRLDARALGELLFLWMATTAVAGELFGVNPYDQPGVEASKRITQGLLGREGKEEYAARLRERPGKEAAFILGK